MPFTEHMGFPGGLDGKASARSAGDLRSIPGLGRSPEDGNGNPLQYSCWENPHEQRRLVGYSPWGHRESDRPERLTLTEHIAKVAFWKVMDFSWTHQYEWFINTPPNTIQKITYLPGSASPKCVFFTPISTLSSCPSPLPTSTPAPHPS